MLSRKSFSFLPRLSTQHKVFLCVGLLVLLCSMMETAEARSRKPISRFLYNADKAHEKKSGGSDEDDDEANPSEFLQLGLVLVTSIGVITVLHQFHVTLIPESVVVMLIGMIVGGVVRLINRNSESNWDDAFSFSPDVFFFFLLPPIIFESGYSVQKRTFFHNFGAISAFAVVGTIISNTVISAGLYGLGSSGAIYELKWGECLVFGALISAVDPVATLAVFSEMGNSIDPDLFSTIFGESVLNDAVSIVLFRTFDEKFLDESEVNSKIVFEAVGTAFLIFFGSMLLGFVFGLLMTLAFKHSREKSIKLEVVTAFMFGYTTYLVCESLELSGIVGMLFCGITGSHYGSYNMSPQGRTSLETGLKVIAFAAETAVFAYLGMALAVFNLNFKWDLIWMSIFLCLLGRFLNIFPLSLVLNKFRKNHITMKNQIVMWFAGLRGAIAFALALYLDTDNEIIILTTTLIIVLFTTIVFGIGTTPLVKLLKLEYTPVQTPIHKIRSHPWNKFDNKYFKPFFLSEEALRYKQKLRDEKASVILPGRDTFSDTTTAYEPEA